MQQDIKIKSVKLLDDGNEVDIVLSKDGVNYKADSTQAPHPDFVEAVKKLTVHYAVLTDGITLAQAGQKDVGELLERFTGTGYTINSKETGVNLTGWRKTWRDKVMGAAAPYESFEASDGEIYALMHQLRKEISAIDVEARKFIFDNKRADKSPPKDKNQLDAFTDEKGAKKFLSKDAKADPEAMERVAAMENGLPKKERQTANNPAGK